MVRGVRPLEGKAKMENRLWDFMRTAALTVAIGTIAALLAITLF